jgi:hypothetical protein
MYDSALQILMPTFTILLFGDDSPVGISADFQPPKQNAVVTSNFKLLHF